MTEQQQNFRTEMIKGSVFYSASELDDMTDDQKMDAIMRMKQDETMKWQRLASQLQYYIMVVSLILIAVTLFGILVMYN